MKIETMEAVFVAAFSTAIRKVGLATFKRTSVFGSNDRAAEEMKKAA